MQAVDKKYESGYYRILKDHPDPNYRKDGFAAGKISYVVVGKDAYHVLVYGREFRYNYTNLDDMLEFPEFFEYCPEGAVERQAEIASLMNEVNDSNNITSKLQKQLTEFNPYSNDSGEVTGTGTEISPVGGMLSVKKSVSTVRNEIAKTSKNLQLKVSMIKTLVHEQARVLELKQKELSELLRKAEEAVWSINLYLGKNEDIHVLRTGVPAPSEQKIVLRQMVMYMDEECSLHPKDQGIDIGSVEEFDRWLLEDESHIKQVLYEDKAIVALHVKRNTKSYGDPWVDTEKNKANLGWTYFLIKNGENLYRVYVDINVGEYLFPTTDLFEGIFQGLTPGSKDYMDAIEHSESMHRHYLRVLLILQGLLDRTPIFQPMPRVNLCDPGQCYDYIDFIYDAERQLTDGKPTFDKWQAQINERIDVGHRIIGIFGYQSDRYGERRINPKNATNPQSSVLHVLETREDDKYFFKYDRVGEKRWSHEQRKYIEITNRASCWICKDDNFILNFDAASLEEFKYYLKHRQSRHLYQHMIPLLEECVRLKEKEAQEEQPFRQLLIGQIVQRYKVSFSEVEEKIGELISWWKFKNRTHRSLLSDDELAFAVIMQEWGLRKTQGDVRATLNHNKMVDFILKEEPNTLMIAHKKDNQYVSYTPSNDKNIWTTEFLWNISRVSFIGSCESNPWRLVDKRHLRWEIVYTSECWKDWRINPQRSKVLSDPDLDKIVTKAILIMEKQVEGKERFLPLVATYNDDFKVEIFYSSHGPVIPALLVSEDIIESHVGDSDITWTYTKQGVVPPNYVSMWGGRYHIKYDQSFPWASRDRHVFKIWHDNIEQLKVELLNVHHAKKKSKEYHNKYSYVSRIISEKIYQENLEWEKLAFYAEHGDPELWPDHLESLKLQKLHFSLLDRALDWFAEREIDPVGKTVQEVFDIVRTWGFFNKKKDRHRDYDDEIPKILPLDYLIPPKPPKED